MPNILIRCPEGIWGGQDIPVRIVGKHARDQQLIPKKAIVEVPKYTQSGHFFVLKIPHNFFETSAKVIVQRVEVDCAFLRVNLAGLNTAHRFKHSPPEIVIVRATAPNGQIFCAKVPRQHYDKPHFLVPVPKRALLQAEWIAAANLITTPTKDLNAPTALKLDDNCTKASADEGWVARPNSERVPRPKSERGVLACVSPIRGGAKAKSKIPPDSADDSSEQTDEPVETVAFAWFCNLSINGETHASYLELNEEWGILTIWLTDQTADETSSPTFTLSLKNVSSISFANSSSLRIRCRQPQMEMVMNFPNPSSAEKVEERLLVSKQLSRSVANIPTDQLTQMHLAKRASRKKGEWKRFYDAAFNQDFFVSRTTRRSTWTSPSQPDVEVEVEDEAEADPDDHRPRRNSDWVQMLDSDSGSAFFYNRVTRDRCWDAPNQLLDTTEDEIPSLNPVEPDTFEYPEEEAADAVAEMPLQEVAATDLGSLSGRLEAAPQSQEKQERNKPRKGSLGWHDEVEDPTLPEGWIALLQETGTHAGKVFYVNLATSRSQWKHPNAHLEKPSKIDRVKQKPELCEEDLKSEKPHTVSQEELDSWDKYIQTLDGVNDKYDDSANSANVAGTSDAEWEQRRAAIAKADADGTLPDGPLPPGWTSFRDAAGRSFFMNNNTRQTSWSRPGSGHLIIEGAEVIAQPPPPPPLTPKPALDSGAWDFSQSAVEAAEKRTSIAVSPLNVSEEFELDKPESNSGISSAVDRDIPRRLSLAIPVYVDSRSARRSSLAAMAQNANFSSESARVSENLNSFAPSPPSPPSLSELKTFEASQLESPMSRSAVAAAASKKRRQSTIFDTSPLTVPASIDFPSINVTKEPFPMAKPNVSPPSKPPGKDVLSFIHGDGRTSRRASLAMIAANYASGNTPGARRSSIHQLHNVQRKRRSIQARIDKRHSIDKHNTPSPNHRRSRHVLTGATYQSISESYNTGPHGHSMMELPTEKQKRTRRLKRRGSRRIASSRILTRRAQQAIGLGKFEEGRRVEAIKGSRRGQIGILRYLSHVFLKKWIVEWQLDEQRTQYKQTSLKLLPEPNRRRVMPTIKSMTSVSKVAAKFSPQKNIAKAAEKSPRKARYATRRLRRLSRLAQRIPRSNSISPSHDPSSAAASSSHNDDSRHSWTRSNRRRSGMYSP